MLVDPVMYDLTTNSIANGLHFFAIVMFGCGQEIMWFPIMCLVCLMMSRKKKEEEGAGRGD